MEDKVTGTTTTVGVWLHLYDKGLDFSRFPSPVQTHLEGKGDSTASVVSSAPKGLEAEDPRLKGGSREVKRRQAEEVNRFPSLSLLLHTGPT